MSCMITRQSVKHILVRHEQGAVHAAQGYAAVSGHTGVVLLTSGPAPTNAVTGIADAMFNSTPLVVITGQVHSQLLGTDAFQEVDVIGVTHSVSKWVCQIRSAADIASVVAQAFFIASSGNPGPVVLDITKDAQAGKAEYIPKKMDFMRSYDPCDIDPELKLAHYPITSLSDRIAGQIAGIIRNIDPDIILVSDIISLACHHDVICSRNYGTPGFGLPATIGVKCAAPLRNVCLITESWQFQSTLEELGVICQPGIDVKIFLLNGLREGMEVNHLPNFMMLAKAYGIDGDVIEKEDISQDRILETISFGSAYLLEIKV